MLIAHNEGMEICAHCGKELPGEDTGNSGGASWIFPKGIGLNLRDCERNVLLCGVCRNEKGTSFRGPGWYPYLSDSAKERLEHSLRIAESQLKKRRRHIRNIGEKDSEAYRRMGDLLSEIHLWHG